jgi:hypothetical protein
MSSLEGVTGGEMCLCQWHRRLTLPLALVLLYILPNKYKSSLQVNFSEATYLLLRQTWIKNTLVAHRESNVLSSWFVDNFRILTCSMSHFNTLLYS